ncbi:MAG: hypothetical protein RL693_1882 [Verrucomicrobiota bacterium]|jgi:hypothetical protein
MGHNPKANDQKTTMHTVVSTEVTDATIAGTISFPEVLTRLLAAGVEYYHVDYAAQRETFYGADGAIVVKPIPFEALPQISPDLSIETLRTNILASQVHRQQFQTFSRRAMASGVQG